MKRKKTLLFIGSIFTLLFSCWLASGRFQKKVSVSERAEPMKTAYGSYFFPIAVEDFTRANQPCIPIHINGIPVSATLDLGFRGQLACSPEFLERLEPKKHLGMQKMYGASGGEYEENLYQVEAVEIGPILFSSPVLHEEAQKFHEEATLKRENHALSKPNLSKVGWELFGNTNLFLDLKNSKVGFCDSIETLQSQGYAVSEFVKTPLLLERGFVEFEAEIEERLLRCTLDTGATWNILNTDVKGQISASAALVRDDYQLDCGVFRIDNQSLGSIAFHRHFIKMPVPIEAILGVEFFEQHLVFLDFSKKCIYVSKGGQI